MKELLKLETDKQFFAYCAIIILIGIVAQVAIIAPSAIHKAQIPTYTGEWF